ncbi:hypothetical protein ACFTXB_34490, partial [Streptomyces sp. NPDC057074]
MASVRRAGGSRTPAAPHGPCPRARPPNRRPAPHSEGVATHMPIHASVKHPHDDAPDTADAFRRLTTLPDGPERDAVRDRIVEAWLPMAERLAGRFRSRG